MLIKVRRESILSRNFLYFTAIAFNNCQFYHPVSLPYCNFWQGLESEDEVLGEGSKDKQARAL